MRALVVVALVACRGPATPLTDAADVAPTCVDECVVTELTATFEELRVLDRAVFGQTTSDSTLRVEAYLGGEPGCPMETSATPDYVLVLGKVAPPNGPAPTSSPGNVLDFIGDLLGGELGAQAELVIVKARAASLPDFVALDVYLEFAGGMLSGHLYATHCDSLDSP